MKFEEVKKDYLEITSKVGFPYDMTGGFVDAEHMEIVILNPTKANAKKYMLDVITYGFQNDEYWTVGGKSFGSEEYGKNISINDNEIVKRMYEKYCR